MGTLIICSLNEYLFEWNFKEKTHFFKETKSLFITEILLDEQNLAWTC